MTQILAALLELGLDGFLTLASFRKYMGSLYQVGSNSS